MLGSAESGKVRLISREIIFTLRPIWPRYLNVTDRRTDGRTDNLPCQYRAPLPYAPRVKKTNKTAQASLFEPPGRFIKPIHTSRLSGDCRLAALAHDTFLLLTAMWQYLRLIDAVVTWIWASLLRQVSYCKLALGLILCALYFKVPRSILMCLNSIRKHRLHWWWK